MRRRRMISYGALSSWTLSPPWRMTSAALRAVAPVRRAAETTRLGPGSLIGSRSGAESGRRFFVDPQTLRVPLRIADDHDAVVAGRSLDAHVLVAHVGEHALSVALERRAPA